MRAESGDRITEVDMIPTHGVCQDGIGTGSERKESERGNGSRSESVRAEVTTALVAAAGFAAVAAIV